MTDGVLAKETALQRRAEIVDAAERYAKANGLHQLKLRDVAKEAGCSLGNLYNYFQNKEKIVEALVDREVARFINTISTRCLDESMPLYDKLRLGFEHIVDVYLDPESVRLLIFIASESLINPRVRELKAKADQRLRRTVMDLILSDKTNGEVPVEKLRTQIFLIRSFLESLRGAFFFGVDLDRETVKKMAVERLMLMVLFDRSEWRGKTLGDVVSTSEVFRASQHSPN